MLVSNGDDGKGSTVTDGESLGSAERGLTLCGVLIALLRANSYIKPI